MTAAVSTDQSGAPWPYEPATDQDDPDATPTWECPGGQCACHAPEPGELARVPHRITFYDHRAERMPGARCRILENGRLLNAAAPYADGAGAVEVELTPETRHLQVEWAPADLPDKPRYPFRKLYYVDVGLERDQNVERRLHNLGYGAHSTLFDNVCDFQESFGRPVTGQSEDIEVELIAYHDTGTLPPRSPAPGGPRPAGDRSNLAGAPGDSAAKLAPGDAKAKRPPGSGAGPGAPGPGLKGGKQPSGTLAVQTKLTIKLVMQFSLRASDFNTFDTQWGSEPYDVAALLAAYYPKGDMRKRFSNAFPNAFIGAELTLHAPGAPPQTAILTDSGKHAFDLPPGTTPRKLTLDVVAHKDRRSPTNRPAGPGLTNKDTTADFYFRSFKATFHIDGDGVLIPDRTTTDAPKPAHGRVFSETGNAKSGSELVLDWRPDLIRAGGEKARNPRRIHATNNPVNPFDAGITRGEQARSPPILVIHQTTRKDISFLIDFVGTANENSIHYGVDLDGFIVKTVDEHYATGHAGPSMWRQRADVRDFSVGVETCHSDRKDPSEASESGSTTFRRFFREQIEALARLADELQGAFPIARGNVVGHVEVRTLKPGPSRILSRDKVNCPGYHLDWERLETLDVALTPLPISSTPPPGREADWANIAAVRQNQVIAAGTRSADVLILKQMLFDIGYSVSETLVARDALTNAYDRASQEAVRAFQTRHLAGHRVAHTMFGKATPDKPMLTTLDQRTIASITQVWWAVINDQLKPPVEPRAKT